MTKITNEMIVQINELYKEIKTYSGVARKLGIAATTVKKYIQSDYIPKAELQFKPIDVFACRNVIEHYTLPAEEFNNSLLLDLTEEEYEEIQELWKELSV
jgi:predicted transcriptional regulator